MDAQVEVVASSEYGRTFRRHAVLGPVPSNLMPAPGISLPTGPSIATDPRDGNVYVAYATYRAGTAHVDIMVAHSRDGGRTWSVPLRVTTDPVTDGITYFQPQIAVDDAGGVDVTFFALAHGRVAVILARSTAGGTRFVSRLDVTDSPFDPSRGLPGGGKHGRWWIGDYQGLAAGGGMIHPFWNDTRTGHLDIFTAAIAVTAVHR
jgi:hypothetical protein